MESEFLQLAREAVAAMQGPTWTDVAGAGIGVGQLLLIGWGLRQMGKSSKERNRQLDMMEAAQREQSQVLAELLRRTGTA